MKDTLFVECLKNGKIPQEAPSSASVWGRDWMLEGNYADARRQVQKMGMYAIVDQTWVRQFVEWLDGRTVLEIMAGAGWLAKALAEQGVDVIATDDRSWEFHKHAKQVHPVECMEASEAVQRYRDRDVLIVSWPPHQCEKVAPACALWDKLIVYIGEDSGGCTASDAFFEGFYHLSDQPYFYFLSWPGIHDSIHIGRFDAKSKGDDNA